MHGSDYRRKLSDADVVSICSRLQAGETQTALAREFHVSQPTVSHIKNRAVVLTPIVAPVLVVASEVHYPTIIADFTGQRATDRSALDRRHIRVLANALQMTVEALRNLGIEDTALRLAKLTAA